MRSSVLSRLVVVAAILMSPLTTYAQEATLSGTVIDATGAVLPGVTIQAVHAATGNAFEAVTDERGAYRISVRVGAYQITAELPGFTTITRSVELLVGQQAIVNLQLAPSTVQESVTVTGEAPLIDVTSSRLGGNIDPKQASELPVNGRNWLDLALLAPGSRANSLGGPPVNLASSQGMYQVNLDGQQVTQLICCGQHQPGHSKDAIGEFEFISNRFDATQGRSAGVQVNAITKSGTNTPAGSLSGYFRDDRFNAADLIQKRVLPYSNQQVSGTFGGPIVKNKIHFFANYEQVREPQTYSQSSPFPSFNVDLNGTRREKMGGGRGDVQFSSQTRLTVRSSAWSHVTPFDNRFTGGATLHPSTQASTDRYSKEINVSLTQVLGTRALNEVKGGYVSYTWWTTTPYVKWAGGAFPDGYGAVRASLRSTPRITLRGYAIGTATNLPQSLGQDTYSVRDDFTFSFNKGGQQTVKLGGEYLSNLSWLDWCQFCNGSIDANNAAVPANLASLFPVWNDASTWNLAALSPITVRYRRSVGTYAFDDRRHLIAGWVQDDWAMTSRLTLNLGVRYDVDFNSLAENIVLQPWLTGDRPSDTNNLSPRIGFAYKLADRTVLRGGYGTYFTQLVNQPTHNSLLMKLTLTPETPNDGRPDFAANPYNGNPPTFAQVEQNLCSTALRPGCQRRDVTSPLPAPSARTSYSHQASIGLQQQLGTTMSVEANYVFTGSQGERRSQNINMTYNPATGANYPFTDLSKRPFPEWGVVNMDFMEGRSNYHGLETSFTKRLSQRWQASATYTLSALRNDTLLPVINYKTLEFVPFPVATDVGGEYGLAPTDQRHRAVFNGIWQVGYGFQLSGLYFYGSGERQSTTYGGDLRNTGGTSSAARLAPNGTIVPRADFVGSPIHRVDLRIQRRVHLRGRVAVEPILEVFNLFNHANYGVYQTAAGSANYKAPSFSENMAYQPRMAQMGFRATF